MCSAQVRFGSENVLQSISICVFCQRSSQKLTFTLVPTETRACTQKLVKTAFALCAEANALTCHNLNVSLMVDKTECHTY